MAFANVWCLFWYVPLQDVHGECASVNEVPAEQFLQDALYCACSSWYIPGAHVVQGNIVLAYPKPVGQNEHTGEKTAFSCWYLPDMHDVHACDVFVNLKPAGQKVHSAGAAAFSCWYLPAAQA